MKTKLFYASITIAILLVGCTTEELELESISLKASKSLQYWNTATSDLHSLSEGTTNIIATPKIIKQAIGKFYNKPNGWSLNENSINDYHVVFVHKKGLKQPYYLGKEMTKFKDGWFAFAKSGGGNDLVVDFKKAGKKNYYHINYIGPGQAIIYRK